MTVLTQDQIALQMLFQLRVFDPSVSAEIGTPERKLIDTFAEALAEAQVNLSVLGGALDFSAKFGSDLDNFLALFGFGRQQGAFATGFVTFARATPSAYNITIPNGTQVSATITVTAEINSATTSTVVFRTTSAVTLPAGQISVVAPLQAVLAGSQGNVAASAITQFANLGSPPPGITTVTNLVATTGGADVESDAELKARFKNTVFRNLAGTEDQYLATAMSTQFTTKANVLGPISRYQEYMQVPTVDDSQSTIDGSGNGAAGQWTTTPSNNPYSKYVYSTVPYFLSNGGVGGATVFYRQDTDFVLNAPPLNAGETFREFTDADTGAPDIANPLSTPNNPNLTLFNVYAGADPTVQLPRPSDVVLFEYSYCSTESRNDPTRGITNCVDVYVDGENPTTADAIVPPPSTMFNLFTSNPADKFYAQSFRRIGQPDVSPTIGNGFTALYWQPVIDLPGQIVAGSNTYLLDIHYWPVEDKTVLANTVRSRNGIEWNLTLNGKLSADPTVTVWTPGQDWATGTIVFYNGGFYSAKVTLSADAVAPAADPGNWLSVSVPFTGQAIPSPGTTNVPVTGYTYDKNVVDLQAALDGVKQVTSDVLGHRAAVRYFKFDFTIVYSIGASPSATNAGIQSALSTFLAGQYFGSIIQLSDLLVTVRNVAGVQNVRWSNDVVNPNDDFTNVLYRVTECDVNGNPRASTFTGTASNGSNQITSVTLLSGPAPTTTEVVLVAGIPIGSTITGISGPTYTLSHIFTGTSGPVTVTVAPTVFNTDFYLRDNELPALSGAALATDTLSGLILRPRSSNTFNLV